MSLVYDNSVGSLLILLMSHFTFLQELKRELLNHFDFIYLRDAIQADPASHSKYTITKDLILQKRRIWLPKGLNFIQTLLTEFHTTPMGGIWVSGKPLLD